MSDADARFTNLNGLLQQAMVAHGAAVDALAQIEEPSRAVTQGLTHLQGLAHILDAVGRGLPQVLRETAGASAPQPGLTAQAAITDDLTGLANATAGLAALDHAMRRAKTTGRPLTVALVDVDGRSDFGRQCGRAMSDHALRLVAAELVKAFGPRRHGEIARIGEDEFLVLMPEAMVPKVAFLMDALRNLIAGRVLVDREVPGRTGAVTVSIGVEGWTDGDDIDALLERARAHVARAKQTGGNRVDSA